MILVDTSIWIDHLHAAEPRLIGLLDRDDVGTHAVVIEELAVGSIADRSTVLGLLAALRRLPTLRHDELLELVDRRRLGGRGLSVADIHLLGAVLITPGAELWTRDRRLRTAAEDHGVPLFSE